MKSILFVLCIFFTIFSSSAVLAEQRNLTSYHPSPFGFFDQLRLVPQDPPVVCDGTNKGVIYFDEAEGKLMTCGNSGVRLIAVWEQDGLKVYPGDDSSSIFWGIGDQTPDAYLELSASGAAHHLLMVSSDDDLEGDVFTVRNNGRVGIGASVPDFRLTIDSDRIGSSADGGILSYGTLGSGADISSFNSALLLNPTFVWYPRTGSLYARRMADVSALAYNQYNYGFGYDPVAEGYASFASGDQNQASGNSCFAAGSVSQALGQYSFVSGNQNNASGDASVALGQGNAAGGLGSVSIGDANQAMGSSSVGIGQTCVASNDYSVALGIEVQSNGIASMGMGGPQVVAAGNYSFAFGEDVGTTGEFAMAFGHSTSSSGSASFSSGVASQSDGANGMAVGLGAGAPSYAQTAMGCYNAVDALASSNAWVATEQLFTVGNGIAAASLSTAFSVLKNGNVAIGGMDPGIYRLRVFAGDASVDAANAWRTLSDRRLKKNVETLGPVLALMDQLTGVTYHALNEDKDDPVHIGLIAQDVEKVFPSLVVTDTTSPENYKSLAYGRITPVIAQSIKELKSQQEEIETKVSIVEEKLQTYIQRLNEKAE